MEQVAEDASDSELRKRTDRKRKLNAFARLGIDDVSVVRGISKLGFRLPTPVQRKCIPIVMAGRDLVAMARTGSGKTAAFGIPVIAKLKAHSETVGLRCLVLEPTRELAFQVCDVLRKLSFFMDLRIYSITGGSKIEAQFQKWSNNPDVIVGCPGRLMQILVETQLSLTAVQYFVLDEGDQLFEAGFNEQIQFLLQQFSHSHQTIIMSATLPKDLVEFSTAQLKDPCLLRLDVFENIPETLDVWFLYSRPDEKVASFLHLIQRLLVEKSDPEEPQQGIIVFVASRHHVEFLSRLLRTAQIEASVNYSSIDPQARIENMARFRRNQSKVLIVTDIAARGLDIPLVKTVVNFDFPTSPKHFLHRVGRTARAGKQGLAVSIVTKEDVPYLTELLLFAGLTLEVATDQQHSQKPDVQYGKLARKPVFIGSLPPVSLEIEFVQVSLKEDAELHALEKCMQNSYCQYFKVRRPPSVQSARKAKEWLRQHIYEISSNVHPGFLTVTSSKEKPGSSARLPVKKSDEEKSFLKELSQVTPRDRFQQSHGRLTRGGVLSCEVVRAMSSRHNFSTVFRSKPPSSQEPSAQWDLPGGLGLSVQQRKPENFMEQQRMQNSAVSSNIRQLREEHYKVNSSFSPSDAAKAFRKCEFEVLPDDDRDQRKVKFAKKWNAKRKKYMMASVDAVTGRVLKTKQLKKRNESGVIVRGELKKTGLYDKWKKNTKRYIQPVGQKEQQFQPLRSSDQSKALTTSAMLHSESSPEPLHCMIRDPALSEKVRQGAFLTRKEQRKVKKLAKLTASNPRGSATNAKDEVLKLNQIEKNRREAMLQKLRECPKYKRRAINKEAKQNYLKKQRVKAELKQAPRRSFLLLRSRASKSKPSR